MKCIAHSLLTFAAAIVAALVVGGASVHAVVLFSDDFNRGDNNDIDADTTGITNSTGTVFGASAVYSQPWIDPNSAAPIFGAPDGNAANGGGQRILSGEYQLKYGTGTSNSFVNHNFTNASILSMGGYSVSLDVVGYNQTTNGQGAAIAVGMSQAEALTAQDAFSGTTRMTNAFTTAVTANTIVSDFYLALRGDGTMAWGIGTGNSGGSGAPAPTSVSVGSKTGTISANFGVTSFAVGATVDYEVFFNGVSKGVGQFTWSGTNENYIGLDGRDSTAMRVDNFEIETVLPPPKPVLTINRDTGNITLVNETSQALSITVYSMITADGGFNQANWNTIEEQNLDLNDPWFQLSAPSSTTDLSEGTLGEYTIAASNAGTTDQINFGNAWIPSPFEDIAFELRNAAGGDVPVLVEYVGNGGESIGLADYNHSGTVDSADWAVVRGNLISDVSSLSTFQRYLEGDLNDDGFVNSSDFRLFKGLYEADNGLGSFAALANVPEPSTLLLLTAGIFVAPHVRRRAGRRTILTAVALLASLLIATDGVAADLFRDNFNRPDNTDIDAVTTGIVNNTGTPFGASAVYSQPWIDPNSAAPTFGAPDADPANGGGQRILNNEYQIKYGVGTSNSFVNHNFTNASILTAGAFSVSLDVVNYVQTTNGQGVAIAVGMSQAEALMGRDANDGSPALGAPGFKYSNGFQNGATTATVLSDFYVALRGDNTLAWGIGGTNAPAPTVVPVTAKTGTISARFVADDFNAGSTVAYEIFYNGVSHGFGAFTWSGTNENYIGLDGRDNTAVQLDNYKVETLTGVVPQVLKLQVNTTSGAASIAGGGTAASLDFYEIRSAGAGLVTGSFDGLRGAAGFPSGNGTGNGWELSGVLTSSSLSESYLQDSSTFAVNGAAVPLGSIYNTGLNTRDLQFFYEAPDGTRRMGFVEYVTGGGIAGDFDSDGDVDGRDFLVWQRNTGVGNLADWKDNYGVGPLAAVAAVPEPTALVMGVTVFAYLVQRRRS